MKTVGAAFRTASLMASSGMQIMSSPASSAARASSRLVTNMSVRWRTPLPASRSATVGLARLT